MTSTRIGMWWIGLVVGGCLGGPQPIPPNERPVIDGARISSVRAATGALTITGAERAITPAAGTVFLDNISRGTSTAATVTPTGSFQVQVDAANMDRLRVRATNRVGRATPIDRIVEDGNIAEVPVTSCVSINPSSELDFGAVAATAMMVQAITVRNDCIDGVLLSSIRLATVGTRFSVEPITESILPVGQTETLVVRVNAAPGAPSGESVNHAIINVEEEPRVVSLYVTTP